MGDLWKETDYIFSYNTSVSLCTPIEHLSLKSLNNPCVEKIGAQLTGLLRQVCGILGMGNMGNPGRGRTLGWDFKSDSLERLLFLWLPFPDSGNSGRYDQSVPYFIAPLTVPSQSWYLLYHTKLTLNDIMAFSFHIFLL